jgi:hypothetical protein
MTDVGRMSMGELVGKVLAKEHADVVRMPCAGWLSSLMEAEVTAAAGAGYGAQLRADGWTRRLPGAELGSGVWTAVPRAAGGAGT